MNKTHKEFSRSVDLFPTSSAAATSFTLHVPCFPGAAQVCGSLCFSICIVQLFPKNIRLHRAVSLATMQEYNNSLLNFFQSKTDRGSFGVAFQSALNMESILLLAERFRRCAVCPLAHWSRGQVFEHPSCASACSPEPS